MTLQQREQLGCLAHLYIRKFVDRSSRSGVLAGMTSGESSECGRAPTPEVSHGKDFNEVRG